VTADAADIDLDDIVVRSARVVGRRIADEFLLVPLASRGANVDSIYNLNRVATFIWERFDGTASGREIVTALSESFDVAYEQASRDYLDFVGTMLSIGAVERGAVDG
jgi:hypothetical protein